MTRSDGWSGEALPRPNCPGMSRPSDDSCDAFLLLADWVSLIWRSASRWGLSLFRLKAGRVSRHSRGERSMAVCRQERSARSLSNECHSRKMGLLFLFYHRSLRCPNFGGQRVAPLGREGFVRAHSSRPGAMSSVGGVGSRERLHIWGCHEMKGITAGFCQRVRGREGPI